MIQIKANWQAMPGVTPCGHSGFQPSCACWEVSQALPDTTALWLRVPAERFSENLQFPPDFHFSITKRVPVRTPENISDARIGVVIVPVLSVSFDRHFPCALHHREKRYSRGWPDTPWLHCRRLVRQIVDDPAFSQAPSRSRTAFLCRTRPGKANCPAGSADPPGAISSNVRHRFPAQTVPPDDRRTS